ncbi:MAG: ankyrin repeat domain-containing protein, partial [Chloroflexota bacterium]|nr:ankyrin repeat domain-containing protein [Chloroflexota bacterium]
DAARLATLLQGDPSAASPVGAGPVPLMWAARYGNRVIIQLLLEAGAEPNVWRDEWNPPLDVAVRYQEDDVIQLLLDHGADPDFKGQNGRSETLACALRNGTVRSLEMLLDAGADPNRADNFFGAWGGNLAKIKLLLDHGRVVGKDRPPGGRGQEDLSVAASNGQNAAVELLLCHGADLDHVDKDGLTAIQQARKAHHASTVELLTEHAEIRKLPGTRATQLLNHRRRLIDAYIDGTAAEVAAVLDGAPSLLESNVVQVSLLHDAAWNDKGDVVDVMVERGAAMTIHAAAALGRVETVGSLLDADPCFIEALYEDQPMAELTPLKVAAHRAQIGVVELLLDRGAEINGQAILANGGHGRSTVVHAAVSSGSVAMLKLLLERGANINLKNRWGASPLATNWRSRDDVHRSEIRDLLVAHGANPEDQPQELLMH